MNLNSNKLIHKCAYAEICLEVPGMVSCIHRLQQFILVAIVIALVLKKFIAFAIISCYTNNCGYILIHIVCSIYMDSLNKIY